VKWQKPRSQVEHWAIPGTRGPLAEGKPRPSLAQGWRLARAGVAFGFGGAVEGWAIVPVFMAILL
jgi:hypothetical protein